MSKGSIKIKTAESDSVCGVDLNVNKVYLLNGKWSTREMIKIFYYLMSLKILSIFTYHYNSSKDSQNEN